jgi:DNA-binding GntR family transcriptional regulator
MIAQKKRKADAIVLAIEAKIINGDLRPGEKLDERNLAETFNVSRTPIREALLRLVSAGMITDSGRGSVIVSKPTVSAVLDAFLVVSELEGLAARQSARRILPEQNAALIAANSACEHAANAGDFSSFNAANMRLHDMIIESAQNQLLTAQLKSARVITLPYRHFVTRFPGYMVASVAEHAAIIASIASGDADLAHRLMREHVSLQGEQLIDAVRMLELETSKI